MRWKIALALSAAGASALALELLAGIAPSWQSTGALAAPPAAPRLVAAAGLVEPATEARPLEGTMVGRLVAMNVAEGDRVQAGEVLAEIENADLKAQLAGAQATLAVRENELRRLLTGARPQEIDQARAALREAEAAAAEARSNYERQKSLEAKKIVSTAVVEQALAGRDTSEAHRAAVAAQLSLLTAPPRVEDAAIARANVDSARARVEEIGADIEKTLVRSPIDGVILKIYRRKGEMVTNLPPTPIVTIGDTSRLRVRADIDQADVANVTTGQTAWITADAFGGKRFRGTVVQLGAQLGRKNFRTDDPDERVDTKILDALIDLDPGAKLPVGLPVDVVFDRAPAHSIPQPGDPARPVRPKPPEAAIAAAAPAAPLYRGRPARNVAAAPAAAPAELTHPPQPDAGPQDTPAANRAMVQIGSYNSAEWAKSAWQQFKANHDQLVTGLDADIREANLGDAGIKYRLRFGPLSFSAAAAQCEALKLQGDTCLVVNR